jgi:hypothetical protein
MPSGAIPGNMVYDRGVGNMTRQQPAKSNDVKSMSYSKSRPPVIGESILPSDEPTDINAPDTLEKCQREC